MSKSKSKQNRKNIDLIVSYLKSNNIIKNEFSTKEELVEIIKNNKNSITVLSPNDNFKEWNKEIAVEEVNKLEDYVFNNLIKSIESELSEIKTEDDLYDYVVNKLNKIHPNVPFELREINIWGKNSYALKFYTPLNAYLFGFDGTISELVGHLSDLIYDDLKKTIKCPYCDNSKLKHEWKFENKCTCGADIVHEVSRPNKLNSIMDFVGGKRVLAPDEDESDWGIWFLDKDSSEKFDYITSKDYSDDDFIDKYIKKHSNYLDLSPNEIEVPEPNNSFSVNKNLMLKILDSFCRFYVEWVMFGKTYDLVQYNKVKETESDKFFRLIKHTNFESFLEECSGRQIYSYSYNNMSEYFNEFHLNVYYRDYIEETYNCDFDEFENETWDDYDTLSYDILDKLIKHLSRLNPIQVWLEYKDIIIEEKKIIANKVKEIEIKNEKDRLKSLVLWDEYFPEIKKAGKLTIDKCKDLGFFEKLKNVIPTLNEEEYNIMKNNPPKNDFSNSALYNFNKSFK